MGHANTAFRLGPARFGMFRSAFYWQAGWAWSALRQRHFYVARRSIVGSAVMRGSNSACLVALCAVLLALPGVAGAALVTFAFEAEFRFAGQSLIDAGVSTTNLRGSYTFETTTLNSLPEKNSCSSYTNALVGLSFRNVANTVTGSATSGDMQVCDNGGESGDDYLVSATAVTGKELGGKTLGLFFLVLADFTETGLTSEALSQTPPDLSKFQIEDFPFPLSPRIDLRYDLPEGPFVRYEITSLTLAPTPVAEPPTLPPLALLVIVLGSASHSVHHWRRPRNFAP